MRTSKDYLVMVHCHSMSMLDNIAAKDKLTVLFYTPETKQQSQQWLVKGTPGLIKAKAHATRKKQMQMQMLQF